MPCLRYWIISFLLCLTSLAAPATAEVIHLTYAWPENIRFKVNYSMVESTRQGRQKVELRVFGTSTLSTKKHPKGLQVDYTEGKISSDILGMSHAPFEKKLQEFFLELGEIDSGYVIGPNAELVEIFDFEGLQSRMRAAMHNLLGDLPPSSQKIQAMRILEKMTGREQMMYQFKNEWRRDVGQWHGRDLEYGEVYLVKGHEAIPMFPGLEVPLRANYTLVGKAPCNESDTRDNCVEIHLQSEVDDRGLEKLLSEIDQEMERKTHPPRKMTVNSTMTLITEPATLLPHKMVLNTRTMLIHADGITIEKNLKHEEIFEYPVAKE